MGPNYDAPLGTTIISLPGSGVVVHVEVDERFKAWGWRDALALFCFMLFVLRF